MRASGITASCVRRLGTPVFMLHRVLPDIADSYSPQMAISTRTFERFLQWVTSVYDVVPLATVIAEPGRIGRCALTFDDGWADVFDFAFPLMQASGVTAAIFVPTRFVGTARRFWQERLPKCLRELRRVAADRATALIDGWRKHYPWLPSLSRATYGEVRRVLLTRPSSEAEEFIRDCERALNVADVERGRAFMNWDEVRALHAAGFTIGSHTANHVLLTHTDGPTSEAELLESRNELELRLGASVTAIAYPWGAIDRRVEEASGRAGYQVGVTTVDRLLRKACQPLRLPRVFVSESVLCAGSKFSATKVQCHLARLAVGL